MKRAVRTRRQAAAAPAERPLGIQVLRGIGVGAAVLAGGMAVLSLALWLSRAARHSTMGYGQGILLAAMLAGVWVSLRDCGERRLPCAALVALGVVGCSYLLTACVTGLWAVGWLLWIDLAAALLAALLGALRGAPAPQRGKGPS